jgi:transcriptional regulator with PAS, ATPase and Fis domain
VTSLAQFIELQTYLGWQAEDEARVQQVGAMVLAGSTELIDDFYDEMQRHPNAMKVITGGPETVARLKSTLRHWLRQLVTGPYDEEYLITRTNVGRRHVEIGLDQMYANVALARLRQGILNVLERDWPGDPQQLRATQHSLNKLIDLDAAIIQDAYESEYLARQQSLSKENQQLRAVLDRTQGDFEIVGESDPMQAVYRLIERAGPTQKPILIEGESGTGKELVARALHRASAVAHKPLVVINCAALPEALLESELFGHERGAFTGAVAEKQGLFEVADGGTLFIDEIGELAGGLQAKLLRVLEDGMLRRVGSVKESRVQVRLLAATNRDLAQEVAAGRFREDLYYRINVLRIHLPPLRERKGDVRLLVEHFAGGEWQWSEELIRLLERYGWPGNVRQLQNALDRAKILADDEWILPEHLPPEIFRASQGAPAPTPSGDAVDLETINRLHVTETLERCSGNKARTARALGISRRTLYRLLEKYDVER